MENGLQQESDNSLQGKILNNSSFKTIYSVRVDNFYTGSPETHYSLFKYVIKKKKKRTHESEFLRTYIIKWMYFLI